MNKYIPILILMFSILQGSIYAQDGSKKISFTTSSKELTGEGKGNSSLRELSIEIDRKKIKKVERVYIVMYKAEDRERVLVKAIDPAVLKGEKKDKKVKHASISKNKVSINLGAFVTGDYTLYLRIKDGKKKVYSDRQKITL